jgi:hypothetical protein
MPPDKRASVGSKCSDKATNAFVSTRNAGDDHVIDNERSRGAAVVLTLGGQRDFPD